MSRKAPDVLIVGGGIIGCAIAGALRRAGANVTVLEQGRVGAQASSAAVGLLAPLRPWCEPEDPYMRLLLAAWRTFPAFVVDLQERTGIDVGLQATGTLRLVSAARRQELPAWIERLAAEGVHLRALSDDQVQQAEPLLQTDGQVALAVPEEAQVQAGTLTQAVAQAALQMGAALHPYRQVVRLCQTRRKVRAVQTADGETFPCGHLILATGAWSGQWSGWLRHPLPVTPQLGEVVTLQQPTPALRHILFGHGVYLAPRQGTVIVGATAAAHGYDTQVTAGGLLWLLQRATQLVPALATAPVVGSWAGLRPRTPDKRPILGRAPGWQNVVLATGHNGFGITLSAITGQAIADLISTGTTPALIQPFGVERFAQPPYDAAAHARTNTP